MIAHTPGDWIAQQNSLAPHLWFIWSNDGRVIAMLAAAGEGHPDQRLGSPGNPETAKANALLMAKAPKLLEALEDLLDAQKGTATRVLEATHNARLVITAAKGTP